MQVEHIDTQSTKHTWWYCLLLVREEVLLGRECFFSGLLTSSSSFLSSSLSSDAEEALRAPWTLDLTIWTLPRSATHEKGNANNTETVFCWKNERTETERRRKIFWQSTPYIIYTYIIYTKLVFGFFLYFWYLVFVFSRSLVFVF